jgi:ribosome-associated protein
VALTPRQLALRAVELALSKKAEDVVLLDLRQVTNIADFFVICTASSDTQMRAVGDAIMDGLAAAKHKVWHAEGYEVRRWVLLDYVHVVVHILLPETRQYYALEKLWGDAPTESFGD